MAARPSPRLSTATPWIGVNFWSRAGGPFMWREYDDAVVRAELRELANRGITVTRSFFHWPDFQPAPDHIDDALVERFKSFLLASEEIGLTTIPTFIVGHMSGANFDVSWRAGRDLYSDGFMLGQQAFFIREMVRRVGESPAIVGWLISNEMPHYGGFADHQSVRAWGLICANAVRAGGSLLPVSLGDGAWTQEVVGRDNGFRLRDQIDVVDFFGPHAYPAGDDQTRQFAEAAFACELSHFGKPVVLEEFGVTDSFCSDEHGGHYYRQVLHQSLLAGATGWICWNNTDFDMLDRDPYRHHPYEVGFGVTRIDGTEKQALRELRDFRRILDAVDITRLERTATRTAVLLPAIVDVDLPMIPQAEREMMPRVCLHSWIAAKAADLSPMVARESESLPDVDLIIVPSNKALLGTTFGTLRERARQGAHIYIAWFAGVSEVQRGAWWPDLELFFGVRHGLRYGMTPQADDLVTLTVTTAFGDLDPGATLTFRSAGVAAGRRYLPVEPTSATVLAIDHNERPALLRHRVGKGAVYLGVYPIEYFGAMRPDAHDDDQTWRLYQALAAAAGVTPTVTVADPRVSADQLRRDDGMLFTWLVSESPDELVVKLQTSDGSRTVDVLDGVDVTDACRLSPYGVRVVRHIFDVRRNRLPVC